jgi:A/G-specific adenine glycosylase
MDAASVNRLVLDWYAANARDLPWRRPPYLGDAYAVLVSEVMLQQTQVDRTVPKFLDFMARFPSMHALAEATPGDVIALWSGMGYNNRAVRLQRLAEVVVADHAGEIPRDVETLLTLPGIGPYTASAVACFAYGASVPVVDTNIYRVLSRLVHGVQAPSRAEVEPLATEFLPANDASSWHQALMDIGATICTVQMPHCVLCPIRQACAAAPALQDGANRKLAEASVPYAPKQAKFAGSRRYYRGRIVEALRQASPEGLTLAILDALFGKSPTGGLPQIVDSLVRDGLAVREGDTLRLP